MKIKEIILQGIISNIQKRNRGFRTIAGLLAGLTIVWGITHALNYMYVNVESDAWERILWHHFYEDKGKIDNIYLGSSHVFCDLDPTLLDQLSGQYNFNLASSSQRLNGSYYLLREADRTNSLSHVCLEMYYDNVYSDAGLLEYELNWKNLDYMKPSINKAAYWLAVGGADQYINAMLPFSRYRASLGEWGQIETNMERKGQEAYKNYQFVQSYGDRNGKEVYERQGVSRSARIYKDSLKLLKQDKILTEYSLGKKNEEYCRKIIEYCKEREIPITLFCSPIYDLQLLSTMNYDDYTLAIRAFAAEQEVPFYDFNLVKEVYLPIQDGKYFRDSHHLNQFGAEKFTRFFYQVINGEETDNEKYFCDSYEERLKESKPAVFGIYEEQSEELLEERSGNRTFWIASNLGEEMEYRIVLKPDGKRRRQIQDFQKNMTFQVSAHEHGICTIAARVKDVPVEMQTMSIRY